MNLNRIFLAATVLVALCFVPAYAQQNTWTITTLSGAVNACTSGVTAPTCQLNIPLTSYTGVNAPSQPIATSDIGAPSGNSFTWMLVDKELLQVMRVVTIGSTTTVYAERGVNSTKAIAHNSGATVYIGPPNYFANSDKTGACTAANERVLPAINPATGNFFNCYGSTGQWVQTGSGSGQFTGSNIGSFCTGTVGTGETDFLNGAACSGATTATARYVVVEPGYLANLQVFSSAAVVGGSSKDVLTVLKNGSATTITCTIAASGTTCSDSSHSVAVAAGDVITFKFVAATSDTAANVSASVLKY